MSPRNEPTFQPETALRGPADQKASRRNGSLAFSPTERIAFHRKIWRLRDPLRCITHATSPHITDLSSDDCPPRLTRLTSQVNSDFVSGIAPLELTPRQPIDATGRTSASAKP